MKYYSEEELRDVGEIVGQSFRDPRYLPSRIGFDDSDRRVRLLLSHLLAKLEAHSRLSQNQINALLNTTINYEATIRVNSEISRGFIDSYVVSMGQFLDETYCYNQVIQKRSRSNSMIQAFQKNMALMKQEVDAIQTGSRYILRISLQRPLMILDPASNKKEFYAPLVAERTHLQGARDNLRKLETSYTQLYGSKKTEAEAKYAHLRSSS